MSRKVTVEHRGNEHDGSLKTEKQKVIGRGLTKSSPHGHFPVDPFPLTKPHPLHHLPVMAAYLESIKGLVH